jgi:hypothetical protein
MVERGERLGGGVLERREGLMKYVYHSSLVSLLPS